MTVKQIREANIQRHWNSTTDICGGKARARELMCAREKSHKTRVSEQNQIDVYIKMEVNGKITYVPAECKTNGGRVDEMLNGTTKAKYVIYWLDFTQKLKNSVEVRNLPPVVIPLDLFMSMLQTLGIIKAINRNGQLDGYGIQVSSKKLYITLQNYIEDYAEAILFDNTKTFEDWALEGLEMRYKDMIIRGEGQSSPP